LDLHESGIIGKRFERTLTAICFNFLIFDLEYLKQLQSSEPLHAKRPLILLLVRFTVCMCSNRDIFRRTMLQKCGRAINCSWDCGVCTKFHHSAIQTKIEVYFGGFFHQICNIAPANRKTGFYADRDPNKQEVGFIFA
jgi:hypothetical protein